MIDFGTGGFRGVIGETFNKENIQIITQGIANIIKKRKSTTPFVVGYDYRFMSMQAATWVAEVLAGNKIKVILAKEATPTPAVMYTTKAMDNDFGAMITASHNPYYFNGIKVFQKEGMDADITLTNEIELEIQSLKSINKLTIYDKSYKKYVKVKPILKGYLEHIKTFISPEIQGKDTKILFDAIYGTGAISLSKIAKDYQLKNFKTIHSKHDAFFGFMLPSPNYENMKKNKALLLKEHFDCALGIDSDGDRLGMLDEFGNYVDSNEILASLYYYLVKYRGQKGDSVKNCATSNLLDKISLKLGFKCHEVDVGFKNISSKMKEVDALIGGESSGGLTVRNYIYGKDSTFAAMLFIEMMSILDKSVSEIIKEVRDFADFHYCIIEDTLSYNENYNIKEYLYNNIPNFPVAPKEIRKFGKNVKYIFDNDEWAILRLSGTEPVLRAFAEMETKEKTLQYLQILRDFILDIEKEKINV